MSDLAKRESNGRWLRGVSGNPGGRRKMCKEVVEIAREHTVEAIETLVEIYKDPRASAMARVRAAEVVLNRGWGQPATEAELEALDVGALAPVQFVFRVGADSGSLTTPRREPDIEGELLDEN